MTKLTQIISSLATLAIGGIIFASCSSSTSPATAPEAPTVLMVSSVSSSSIGAMWTRGADDTGPDTLIATNGGIPAVTVISTGNTGTLTNLVDGQTYSITVHNGTGASSSISWMTADRTMGLQIFESGDPSASDPSALILGTGTNTKTSSISGISNADFVLETISDPTVPSNISFDAGIVHNSTWNNEIVLGTSATHSDYIVGGLNADYTSTNYQADQTAAALNPANSYDIPNDAIYNTKGSRVLILTTPSGNLALIEIVPDPSTHQLYSTNAAGYKYVTVNVSYQSTVGDPYAARGRAPRSSGPVKRISAQ